MGKRLEFTGIENFASAKKSGLDNALKLPACIWCDFVAMVELRGFDLECFCGIPDHEIGVAADGNRSFSVFDSGKTRGIAAEPVGHMSDRIVARACFRPYGRKANLQG